MKKTIFVFTLIVMLMGTIVGCAPAQVPTEAATMAPVTDTETSPTEVVTVEAGPTSEIVRGGTLTVGKSTDMITVDPTQTNSKDGDNQIFMQVFEPLVGMDESGALIPSLATSWEVATDQLSIEFKLREGVKFHDGTDFNAEAVKANFDHDLDPATNHVYLSSDFVNFASVEVVDEYTVRINVSKPDSSLLTVLTNISGYMMSPAAIAQGADYLKTHAVGTGPFMLSEYIPGDHITVVANPNYYEMGVDGLPLPYLEKVVYLIMTDDSVKTANLLSGDIDMVDYNLSANSTKQLQQEPNIITVLGNYTNTYFMCFNQNDPLLADVKVRQAISYAVNRDELMQTALEGLAIVEPFDALKNQWFYDDYTPYSYDPGKAKDLLTEAGYPDGIEVTLSNIAREPDNTMVQLLQQQFLESKITLKIDTLDRDAWINLIRTTRGGQLGIGVIGIQGLDPNQQYNSLLVYVDPQYTTEISPLLLSAKNTFDQAERKAIFVQFQKAYLDNAFYVILGQNPRYISYSDKVHNGTSQNLAQAASGTLLMKNVWVSP